MGNENTVPLPERETFLKHREFLEDNIDPRFGLVEKLKRNGALSKREAEKVETANTVYERNSLILNIISDKGKYNRLIEALRDANQSHVVNYIIRDGDYKPEFGGEWPLTDRETSILDYNEEFLVENLGMDDLVSRLYASGVISKRQKEFIDSKQTSCDKNKEFLGILRRCSTKGYTQTIRCLAESKQSHIAMILDRAGVAVRVHVNMEMESLDEVEEQLVTKLTQLIGNRTPAEAARILEATQFRVIAASRGQSIILFILCTTMQQMHRIKEMQKSRELSNVIRVLFNQLLTHACVVYLTVTVAEEDELKCVEIFSTPMLSGGIQSMSALKIDDQPVETRDTPTLPEAERKEEGTTPVGPEEVKTTVKQEPRTDEPMYPGTFSIYVKQLIGGTSEIKIDRTASIDDLFRAVSSETGLNLEEIRLTHWGEEMPFGTHKTLEGEGIKNYTTIHLTKRRRTGGGRVGQGLVETKFE